MAQHHDAIASVTAAHFQHRLIHSWASTSFDPAVRTDGEVAGILGQTIAGIVSAGGAVLVFTGLALAIRRLLSWVARRSRSSKPALADVSAPIPDSAGD